VEAATEAKGDNLESIELVDVFCGQKRVAYAFNYRHPE
jgi:phenylalanyl-tRNA synthetase beta subunit